MTDHIDTEARSRLMSRVRSKNTRPEMALRRALHAQGYRYRVHRKDLPGSPDIVFPARKRVVFVHGCFWHRHAGCKLSSTPKSNVEFWTRKFEANVARDLRNQRELEQMGWQVFVIWQCQIRDINRAVKKVSAFLGPEHQ